MDDKELQQFIEQQLKDDAALNTGLTKDEHAYLLLFDALHQEPELTTESRLADRVYNQLAESQTKAESFSYNLTLWVLGGCALLFTVAALLVLSPATIALVVSKAKILLFLIGAVCAVEYADGKLLRRKLA